MIAFDTLTSAQCDAMISSQFDPMVSSIRWQLDAQQVQVYCVGAAASQVFNVGSQALEVVA